VAEKSSSSESYQRQFGVLLIIISILFGVYFFVALELLYAAICGCLLIGCLCITLLAPNTLSLPANLWFRFGSLLSKFFNPVIMTIVYSVTIVPMAILLKLLRIKLITTEITTNKASYWMSRKEQPGSLKDQF
jgi:hypothetical protein